MIDYLKIYGLNDIDINDIKNKIDKDLIYDFEIMKEAVEDNLNYLKSIGTINFKNILLKRPDICFVNNEYLVQQINKYGKDLIVFTFNNAPESLVQFEI